MANVRCCISAIAGVSLLLSTITLSAQSVDDSMQSKKVLIEGSKDTTLKPVNSFPHKLNKKLDYLISTVTEEKSQNELAKIGEPVVPFLIATWNNRKSRFETRGYEIALVLKKIGKPAVPQLIKSLRNKNCEVRKSAAYTLGIIGDKRAVIPLIRQLKVDAKGYFGKEVVFNIVHALGHLKDKRAVFVLTKTLDYWSHEVRRKVVESLSKIGGDDALVTLMNLSMNEKGAYFEAAKQLDKVKIISESLFIRFLKEKTNVYGKRQVELIEKLFDAKRVLKMLKAQYRKKGRSIPNDLDDIIVSLIHTLARLHHEKLSTVSDAKFKEFILALADFMILKRESTIKTADLKDKVFIGPGVRVIIGAHKEQGRFATKAFLDFLTKTGARIELYKWTDQDDEIIKSRKNNSKSKCAIEKTAKEKYLAAIKNASAHSVRTVVLFDGHGTEKYSCFKKGQKIQSLAPDGWVRSVKSDELHNNYGVSYYEYVNAITEGQSKNKTYDFSHMTFCLNACNQYDLISYGFFPLLSNKKPEIFKITKPIVSYPAIYTEANNGQFAESLNNHPIKVALFSYIYDIQKNHHSPIYWKTVYEAEKRVKQKETDSYELTKKVRFVDPAFFISINPQEVQSLAKKIMGIDNLQIPGYLEIGYNEKGNAVSQNKFLYKL